MSADDDGALPAEMPEALLNGASVANVTRAVAPRPWGNDGQASVDLRTALAQSTGGHHSMPSPAARPLSPLATMCAQWRWVAQVRAAFTALFCQLFEGWDMELEPHLDKVRSCTSRCCRLRVAYLTRKHGRRTPPVEVSRDVPSRVPAISACFFRDADILSVPGHRGRA